MYSEISVVVMKILKGETLWTDTMKDVWDYPVIIGGIRYLNTYYFLLYAISDSGFLIHCFTRKLPMYLLHFTISTNSKEIVGIVQVQYVDLKSVMWQKWTH
jgi:hypothetical protein